jgi:peptidoglycan hydrolase-like protein with peptidoglycan-binding domain
MMLRRGSIGSSVSLLQRQLNVVGGSNFPLLVIDGNFGALTDRRVREFQSAPPNILASDGIVGPLTHGKLLVTFISLFSKDLPTGSHRMFAGLRSALTAKT